MVVGGYPNYRKTEIYDLSGQNLNCPFIRDCPIYDGSVGTFINNKTLVCGGSANGYTAECYSYNVQVKYQLYCTMCIQDVV